MARTTIEVIGWTVAITPDDGETWPVTPDAHGKPARPDLVLINVQPGTEPQVTGSGRRQRRDGTEGRMRVDLPWAVLADLPPWALDLAADGLDGARA
jgi:hypothetical protein